MKLVLLFVVLGICSWMVGYTLAAKQDEQNKPHAARPSPTATPGDRSNVWVEPMPLPKMFPFAAKPIPTPKPDATPQYDEPQGVWKI